MPHSEPNQIPDQVDVVIVGGGLSGMSAARRLHDRDVSVAVLEARDRVGGRTWSKQIGKGTFDVGGQWLGPTQDRVASLARELNIGTFPTYHQGKKLLDVDGKLSTYKGDIPKLPLIDLVELQLLTMRFNRMAKNVPLANPAAARGAEKLDGMSLETWKRRNIRSRKIRGLIDAATRVVFGAEPSELSLLHFLFYSRAGGNFLNLCEIDGGAQQDRFVTGAQSLSTGLADKLGDRVCLSAPVRQIRQSDDGAVVVTDRGETRAKYVVVAMPPALVGRIQYDPALPAGRDQLTQRVPMGSTVKCLVTYDEPFWRAAGFSGEVVCTGGPVTVWFDNCSHDNAQPALVGFVVGKAARTWAQRSEADRRRALTQSLTRYFGSRAGEPSEIVEQDWSAEPWTRGCPVGVVPPGVLSTFGTTLRQPVGRLHWAGTETATVWNGYLEGAIEAGERAAREVLRRL